MGTGYTRNDTANNIADGNVINASDLDGEFDAVQAAFNGTTGHSHDGTSGEGPQIATGGLADNAVTTAKITDANVTLAKMAANSIDSDQYVDGSIDTVHIANDAVTLGTKTSGNYVAAGATSGTGISGSVSSEGGTFTVTSNATNANTAGTIVARDGSGNFSAGTITASLTGTASNANQLDSLDSTQFLRSDAADTKTSGDLSFSDNVKANFGTGNDFQIFHDGSNTYLTESGGVGDVYLRANNLGLLNNSNETYVNCVSDGAVTIYHNNAAKLATTSTGVSVTGTASATTFSGDLNGTINTATTATTQTAGDNTTKVATTAFVTTAVNNAEPFPSGTSMLFQQTAAPTGWTKQTTHNDKAIRLTNGTVGTGGSSAFSTAFGTPSVAGGAVSGDPGTNQTVSAGNLAVSISGNISNTTLTTSQMPSHNHTRYYFGSTGPSFQVFQPASINNQQAQAQNNTIGFTGGGGSHNHGHNLSGSMTGSPTLSGNITAGNLSVGASTASINVNYVDFIIANKD